MPEKMKTPKKRNQEGLSKTGEEQEKKKKQKQTKVEEDNLETKLTKKENDESINDINNDKKKQAKKKTKKDDGQFHPEDIQGASPVIYLGHLPPQFAEEECRKFFSQFGKVRRVKIFKSLKSNISKGYGFVQFVEGEVADAAAAAMDGYFLLDRQVKSHVVPKNKLHEGMFLPPKRNKTEESQENTELEEEKEEAPLSAKKLQRMTRAQSKKRRKLEELGIDFTF